VCVPGEPQSARVTVHATPARSASFESVQLASIMCVAEASGRRRWRWWYYQRQFVVASDGDALPW